MPSYFIYESLLRSTHDGMEIGMGVLPYQGKIRQEELGNSISSQGHNYIKEMINTHPKAHINRHKYVCVCMCIVGEVVQSQLLAD